ncbi:MAG: CotH kinase family protein [Bacteroidales bacterium]
MMTSAIQSVFIFHRGAKLFSLEFLLKGMLLLLLVFQSFHGFSDGRKTLEDDYDGIMEGVVFSHFSGFYAQPIQLIISHSDPQAIIRYTTDGSDPEANSEIYDQPIEIRDRSDEGAEISLIPTSPNWKPPSESVPRAMVVKARAFREGFLPGPITQGVFFVNDNNNFFHEIPVVSLITSNENLFNDETGIYVMGDPENPNYHQTGDEWERPAFFELFDENGKHEYSGKIGIRIHGGTSRSFPQKSLRLYFRNEYGDSWLHHELFPDYPVQSFKRLVLRQSGHDMWQTMLRDGFMQSLLEQIHVDRQAFRPAVLYINGEYWGIQNIRERYDKYYLEKHHNVNPDHIDLLAYTSLQIGEGDAQHYLNMIQYIVENGLQDQQHFQHLETLMDIDSYTDYKISEIFFYRWDIGNIRHWRSRTPEGKWRWMMFDLDTGYGGFWSLDDPWNFNMLEYNTDPEGPWDGYLGHNHNSPIATFLLRELLENEDYRFRFITRFADLLNTNFTPEEAIEKLDAMANAIRSEIPAQVGRWNEIPSKEQWEIEIEYMREFARLRPNSQRNHILQHFDLESIYDLTLDVSNQLAGHITLNTIKIRPETPGVGKYPWPWNGMYFGDVPVTLEAIPAPGYRFSHWQGLNGVTDDVITINRRTDLSIKAVFEKIKDPVLIHYWLFDDSIPNDTPLEKIASTFYGNKPYEIQYISSLEGYPFHSSHPDWRRASMERRNNPTSLNYRPEGNYGIPYADSQMRGIQIKQPFRNDDRENSIIFHMSTEGFTDPVMHLATVDEGAAEKILLEYNTDVDSENWTNAGLDKTELLLGNTYQLFEISFINVQGAENNPDFKVRFRFDGPDMFQDNGDRVTFNNISLSGKSLEAFTVFSEATNNGIVEPVGNIPAWEGSSRDFTITPDPGHRIEKVWLDGFFVNDDLEFKNDSVAVISLNNIQSDHHLFVEFYSEEEMPEPGTPSLVVYPNPTSDRFTVKALYNMQQVDIAAMNGQIVQSFDAGGEKLSELDIASLINGLYVVIVRTDQGVFTEKLQVLK